MTDEARSSRQQARDAGAERLRPRVFAVGSSSRAPRWAGPFAELLDWRTYANAAYLMAAFPLGLTYFIVVIVGVALGMSTAVLLVGIPILVGTVGAVAGFGWLERWLAEKLVGLEMPRAPEPSRASRRQGVLAWARGYAVRAVFWKTLAYLILKLPFGVLAFAVMVTLWTLGLGLLLIPVFSAVVPNINLGQSSYTLRLPQLLALSVVGLGVCMIVARVGNLLSHGSAVVARFMLTDSFEEAETQRLRVEALTLASNAASLASGLAMRNELTGTLERVMDSLRAATGASACGLVLDGVRQRIAATQGFPVGSLEGLIEAGVLTGTAPDWTFSSSARARLARPTQRSRSSNRGAVVIVPLEVGRDETSKDDDRRGHLLGHLVIAYPTSQTPARAELGFLTAIADQLSLGLENARLISLAQDRAALEERHRLARELHDSVSQALFGIALGARTAKAQLSRDPAKVAEPLEYVLQLAEAGLSEMRALIFELRPEALETEGLVVALGKQAEAMRVRYKLPVETMLSTEPDVPLEVKQAFLRIAQEALHNTVKHAHATQARLELRSEATLRGATLMLEINDDGQGFDPANLPAGSSVGGRLGQHSMRERAEAIGARFDLETAPGQGTRIRVTLPLEPQPE